MPMTDDYEQLGDNSIKTSALPPKDGRPAPHRVVAITRPIREEGFLGNIELGMEEPSRSLNVYTNLLSRLIFD